MQIQQFIKLNIDGKLTILNINQITEITPNHIVLNDNYSQLIDLNKQPKDIFEKIEKILKPIDIRTFSLESNNQNLKRKH